MEKEASFWGKSELKQSNLSLLSMEFLDHIDTAKDVLQAQYKELETREMNFEVKVRSFHLEMELISNELDSIESLIEEKRKEVEIKEQRLLEVENSVFLAEKRVEEQSEKLNSVGVILEQKSLKVEAMEKVGAMHQEVLDKYCTDIDLKHKQLNAVCEDIDVKRAKVRAIRRSIELKEKLIKAMEVKEKEFGLLKKCMERWSCKLGMKNKDLKEWAEKCELRKKQVESRLKELNMIDKRVSECLNEVQLREKNFGSLGKLINEQKNDLELQESFLQEWSHGLEVKERKLEDQAKDLELKQKEFDLMKTNVHSEVESDDMDCNPAGVATGPFCCDEENNISGPIKVEELESSMVRNAANLSSPNVHHTVTTGMRNLQVSPDASFTENQSMQNTLFNALQVLLTPKTLALKLLESSLQKCWEKGDNISLANDLTKVLQQVGPSEKEDVKENAAKLAVQWKGKMRADTRNSLEVVCFLQFIATYGVISTLEGDEIVQLLGMICQHKQASDLCQKLGFVEKIPVTGFVHNLIERKHFTEAVKFVLTFNLTDKFPGVMFLIDCVVEDARTFYSTMCLGSKSLDEKDEALDNQIADLRAVVQCIKDNNLESEFPSKDIETEIVKLEKLKEFWRGVPSAVEQNQQKEERGSTSRVSFKIEPKQLKSKSYRQPSDVNALSSI